MWWHTVAHGKGSEGETGEWSGKTVLFTLPRNVVHPALLPLMRTSRLPVVDWTDTPADLNRLVRFAERRNLVSARVSSHFKRSLTVSNAGQKFSILRGTVRCFNFLQTNAGIEHQTGPQTLLYDLLPINCLLITISLDITQLKTPS
jgi:hypothetical protein